MTAKPTNFIFKQREQDATFREKMNAVCVAFKFLYQLRSEEISIRVKQHIYLMRLMRYESILEQQERGHCFLLVAFEYKSSRRQTVVFSSLMTIVMVEGQVLRQFFLVIIFFIQLTAEIALQEGLSCLSLSQRITQIFIT
jgi:hypothetical protein